MLGKCRIQKIPLAPAYVGGVIPNRGEVVTTVNLRALLGLEARGGARTVLVLEDEVEGEWFGLMVDTVGGVVMVRTKTMESNPSDAGRARAGSLFEGAYKLPTGLLVQLDPERLRPSRIAETGLFGHDGKRATDEE